MMSVLKRNILLFVILLSLKSVAQFNFQRSWGTYLGDERFRLSDSKIDNDGNLYLVGTIDGSDLTNLPVFTNPSTHQAIFGGGLLLNSIKPEILYGVLFLEATIQIRLVGLILTSKTISIF